MKMAKKAKMNIFIGKRKKAIARAYIKQGTGKIKINKRPLELFDEYKKLRIEEALILAGDIVKTIDINVIVNGGGQWGQIDAARTAIANALVAFSKNEELKRKYMHYDKSLLVSDARRTEPHKPSRSSAGPRRSKQQSKR